MNKQTLTNKKEKCRNNMRNSSSAKIKNATDGITLIALVITIIVLLILAAVSIATLTGENGLLTKTSEAKEETRGASVQEAIDLWKFNQKADQLAGGETAQTKAELLADLKNQNLITAEEYTKLSNGETVTIGSRVISLAKTLVEAFNDEEIKIGDYVNYTPTSGTTSVVKEETGYDETQTYTVDSTTTWRVLGLSENGKNLLLTSGSPIKKDGEDPYLILQGAESYYNCKDVLDKICAIYKNDLSAEVRSMRIEDINNALGITVDRTNNIVYKTDDNSKTNIDEDGALGETYEYVSGNYAPENYLKATYPSNKKYQELTNKRVGDSVQGTSYYYSYTNSNVVEQGSTLYNLLFAGTTDSDNSDKSYWLASPGAYVHPGDYAFFGPGAVGHGLAGSGFGMFGSGGNWLAVEIGVRPVVVLESGVSVADISVIEGSEAPWSTSSGPVTDGYLEGTTGQVIGSEETGGR